MLSAKGIAIKGVLLILLIKLASASPIAPRFLGTRADLFQGDILRTPDQMKNVVIGDRYRWPGGVVKYTFDNAFTDAERAVILSAMAEISSRSCVKFQERQNNEPDYVNIVRGSPGSGCNSYVGRIGGAQRLNLEAPGCISATGPVPHELMHAVGFHHEHARQDRDDFVRVLWDNIDSSMYSAFDKVSGTTTLGFPYDYLSIMQYPPWAFSFNGADTMEPIPDPNVPFGPYDHLSNDDFEKIDISYQGFC